MATQHEDEGEEIDPRRAVGAHGEELAAQFLIGEGWEILERNYTLKVGEIDIITRRFERRGTRTEETRAIVEVKTKQNRLGPPPEASVNRRKRGQLVRLAKLYLQKEDLREVNVRFDVVAVDLSQDEAQITYFPCAFDADGCVW